MKLVFIHGRDQQGKNPEELKSTWVKAWEVGLKKNNLSIPDNMEIIFPFYGDLLDSLVKQAELPDTIEKVIARGSEETPDLDFFNNLLLDVASNAQITENEIIENYEGNVHERGPLNWEWVQAILKTLDKTPIGDISLKRFTYDAYAYLTIPGIKRRINDFVTSKISNEPCVIVGHSLGSAVGYNVLQNNPNLIVKEYITVGSPLGLRSFKTKLATPLSMPICIKGNWYNAYDERDVVALQPLNKFHFNITPEILNYDKVKNHTDNRHGIEGYLNDAVVAKEILNALTM